MGYTSENTVLPNEAGGMVGAASAQLSYLPTALAGVVVFFFSAALVFIITIDELSLIRRVVWQGEKKERG